MKIGFFGITEQEKKNYFLSSLQGHELIFDDLDLNENNISNPTDFDIISVFVQSKINQKVIDAFTNLKMIALRATGFDGIDINYAKSKNIIVSNVPSYGAHTVAEFTFGLILSLTRNIPQAIERVKSGGGFDHKGLRGMDLYGKTLGVIGTGKIGANVIKIAKGFGMIILAFDKYPNQELADSFQFHYVPLDELLESSDIVTIHVPASGETHHLINQTNIFKIKKGSMLINTARGDVVESEALYKAIMQGVIRGAALDVLEDENELGKPEIKNTQQSEVKENILSGNQLIKNPNVIVTPHTAFFTTEAEQAITQTTVENILGFIENTPKNVVNK